MSLKIHTFINIKKIIDEGSNVSCNISEAKLAMEKRIAKEATLSSNISITKIVSSNLSQTKIDTEKRIDKEGTVSSNISQTKIKKMKKAQFV